MKWYLKNFILDSKREVFQIIIIIICFFLPYLVNLSEIIRTILGNDGPTIENAKFYYLMTVGNYMMGLILSMYILIVHIRKINSSETLNRANRYHDKPYWWYLFCSVILGYNSCNLILVPLPMQYKLILRSTFKNYPLDLDLFPEYNYDVIVDKSESLYKQDLECVNLIISDTYPIVESQIPIQYKGAPYISLSRKAGNIGERLYLPKLVKQVVKEVRLLKDHSKINIFSTTNPKNTYHIVMQAFLLANRGNIEEVYVFQQNNTGIRSFKDKGVRVI